MISGGILNGKAISLPKPEYPAAALAVKAKGAVSVQIIIGEDGKVVTAKAISGHPLLRAAAERAAFASEFAPTRLSGSPVKVTGAIVYNFASADQATIRIDKMKVGPMSPEDKRLLALSGKLHIWLYAVIERLAKGNSEPTANETLFVHDGKADIQVELSTRSPMVLEKLKAAGFEFVAEKGKSMVVGRIALDKIAALAEVEEVKLVLPKI